MQVRTTLGVLNLMSKSSHWGIIYHGNIAKWIFRESTFKSSPFILFFSKFDLSDNWHKNSPSSSFFLCIIFAILFIIFQKNNISWIHTLPRLKITSLSSQHICTEIRWLREALSLSRFRFTVTLVTGLHIVKEWNALEGSFTKAGQSFQT